MKSFAVIATLFVSVLSFNAVADYNVSDEVLNSYGNNKVEVKEERELILRAITDAINTEKNNEFPCANSILPDTVKFSKFAMINELAADKVMNIFVNSLRQPSISITQINKGRNYSFIFLTLDSTGKKIMTFEQKVYEKSNKTVNVGTITKPKYQNAPDTMTFKLLCVINAPNSSSMTNKLQ